MLAYSAWGNLPTRLRGGALNNHKVPGWSGDSPTVPDSMGYFRLPRGWGRTLERGMSLPGQTGQHGGANARNSAHCTRCGLMIWQLCSMLLYKGHMLAYDPATNCSWPAGDEMDSDSWRSYSSDSEEWDAPEPGTWLCYPTPPLGGCWLGRSQVPQ